jgi:hypothetical protein
MSVWITDNSNDLDSYINCAVPVLSTSVLDEPWWCFDRVHTPPVRYNELVKLREKMTSPSIGCVNDGFGTKSSSSRPDMDPVFSISFRHLDNRCVRMQRQVAFLKKDAKQCMNKLVWPPEICQILNTQRIWETDTCPEGCTIAASAPFICVNSSA